LLSDLAAMKESNHGLYPSGFFSMYTYLKRTGLLFTLSVFIGELGKSCTNK